jgi:hypothetical protein
VGGHGREDLIGRGEVLTLVQRSARRREFELRRDGALALSGGGSGRVEVRRGAAVGGIVATGIG